MKLVTWNIQRGRGPGPACSLDRLVTGLRAIADFDVLCLQEVSSGFTDLSGCDGSNQFVGLAQRLASYTPVAGLAVDVLDERSGGRRLFGNMIFSRFPVLQVFRHALPWPADGGVMSMQRIALEATLDTPRGPLRVTSTHREYFSLLQRSAQVARLRELRDAKPFTFDFVFASADIAQQVPSVEVCSEVEGPDYQPVLVELAE